MKEIKFIYLESYGCTANQNNAEIMKGIIMQSGLELTNNPEIADLLIINTCIVKSPTENKIKRRISDLQKLKKPIIISGCMPEVRKLPDNLFLLGIHHVKDIAKLIKDISENNYSSNYLSKKNEIKLCQPKIPQRNEIGITQISEGCLGNCNYCITKLARGNLFSYPEDRILENIKSDLKSCREIWLTSQDNAAYGLDQDTNLINLMKKILQLKGRFQVRLGMMNPEKVLPILSELIDIYKDKKMKKFLHLPLQSGSNKILKLMNRKYKVEDFLRIVKKFRQEIPDIFLSTDMIVAYPGEEEKDFQESLEIIKQIKPNILNVNKYWAMQGTRASREKQIPVKIAKERAIKMQNLYSEIRNSKYK